MGAVSVVTSVLGLQVLGADPVGQLLNSLEPEAAERIVQEFESLKELARADDEEIEAFEHVGPTA
ncbi:MAG: hypothetical protein ABEH81_10725 [Halopenitus sp.]